MEAAIGATEEDEGPVLTHRQCLWPSAACLVGHRTRLLVPLSYSVDGLHVDVQLSADLPATDALFKKTDGQHTRLRVRPAVGAITENHTQLYKKKYSCSPKITNTLM